MKQQKLQFFASFLKICFDARESKPKELKVVACISFQIESLCLFQPGRRKKKKDGFLYACHANILDRMWREKRAKEDKNHFNSYYLSASENRMSVRRSFWFFRSVFGAHFAIGNEQKSHTKLLHIFTMWWKENSQWIRTVNGIAMNLSMAVRKALAHTWHRI